MKLFSKILLVALFAFVVMPPGTASMQVGGLLGGGGLTGGGGATGSWSPLIPQLSPLAPLRSFGGTVVSVIPCSGGQFQIGIAPAGLFPIFYIWTPATITKLYGPPAVMSQQVIGLVDAPWVCFVGGGFFSSPIPLYGWRMTYIGTSMPGAGARFSI